MKTFQKVKSSVFFIVAIFILALSASSLWAVTPATEGTEGVVWETDFRKGIETAKKTNRLILLHFYSNNCPPCKQMDMRVFPRSDVAEALSNEFVAIKVDTELNPKAVQKNNIVSIPADLIVTPQGNVVYRRAGGANANQYVNELLTAANEYKAVAQLQLAQNQDVNVTESVPSTSTPNTATLNNTITNINQSANTQKPNAQSVNTQNLAVQNAVAQNTNTSYSGTPNPNTSNTAIQNVSGASAGVQNNSVQNPLVKNQVSPNQMVGESVTPQTNPVTQPENEGQLYPPQPFVNQTVAPAKAATSPLAATNEPVQANESYSHEYNSEYAYSDDSQDMITGLAIPSREPEMTPDAEERLTPPSVESANEEINPDIPYVLDGFCPVELQDNECWVAGNQDCALIFRGQFYLFSNLDALQKFAKNPARYTPVACGEDVVQMASNGERVKGKRNFGAWYQGRIYLFSNQENYEMFAERPSYYSGLAKKLEVALGVQLATTE
ncbi:MAG: DUF255 domain-containing protein [Thermoguttaceae bacterium]